MTEFVFWAALGILGYTYIGYPALIWTLVRCCSRAVHRAPYEPRVTVIIASHNEEASIGQKLENCIALDYPKDKLRILVVSDGSEDETNKIVTTYADRGVTLLAFPVRRGKAACLNDAVAHSGDEVLVFADTRQTLEARAIRYLVENFADPAVGAVSGELVFQIDDLTDFGKGIDVYWRYEKFIRQQESNLHSVVGVTGALYALRREYFRSIPEDTILDDVVIPMRVVMAGRRVVFENRAKAFDVPSRDQQQEKLRKIRTIAGNYQLMMAHPGFLVPFRNPILFQLVSHKVLRLVSPLCMLLLLITNIVLVTRGSLYQILFVMQLVAYALPALGFLLPSACRWKVIKLATAFLLLNWFAVLGSVEFMRNRNAHLWRSERQSSTGETRV